MRSRLGGWRVGVVAAAIAMVALALLAWITSAGAYGQSPTSGGGPRHPGGSPMPGTLPVPAPPDTAVALLRGPSDWPRPSTVIVWPDTARFGAPVLLVLDFPSGGGHLAADSLTTTATWLAWADAPATRRGGLRGWLARLLAGRTDASAARLLAEADLPPAAGRRLTRVARVFHPGPFRMIWEEAGPASPVVSLVGRLAADAGPLPVRAPRSLGWNWPYLAALALLLLGLVYGVARLRRRGQAGGGPRHRPIPPPAYLRTAQELWELHSAGLPARGEGRRFLDGLAIALRHHLAAHYRVHAGEMTSEEVAVALRARGFGGPAAAIAADLLRACDEQRYRPDEPETAWCQARFARALELVERTRIPALFTPVPPDLAVEGEKCWARLRAWLAEGRAVSAGAPLGEGEGV
jgi:hypothetical protein